MEHKKNNNQLKKNAKNQQNYFPALQIPVMKKGGRNSFTDICKAIMGE